MPVRSFDVDRAGAIVEADGLSVGFAERTVLRDLRFAIPRRGITVLLGPAGVGKSTLLRTLARRSTHLPDFWHKGTVLVDGHELFSTDEETIRRDLALLAQHARLYTASVQDNLLAALPERALTRHEKEELARSVVHETGLPASLCDRLGDPAISLPLGLQRRLSLARILAPAPKAVLADEPTRDIADADADALTDMLVRASKQRAVLLITHDQALARRVADCVLFLVAGQLAFAGSPAAFFANEPRSTLIATFLAQGNCWPSEGSFVRPVTPPRPEPRPVPSGFHWIWDGKLGGMPRPGLLGDETCDLAALKGLGVSTLVTLEESAVAPLPERVRAYGIDPVHFPIPDMRAPDVAPAFAMCAAVAGWIAEGRCVVFHCKGGLGRTGTMLAATLIHAGASAARAVDEVRQTCPKYVQSDEQLAFLERFAKHCGASDRPAAPPMLERSAR